MRFSHTGPVACQATLSRVDLRLQKPPFSVIQSGQRGLPVSQPPTLCRRCCMISIMPLPGPCGCEHLHHMCPGMMENRLSEEEGHSPGSCQVKMLPFELKDAVAASAVCRAYTLSCWLCFAVFNGGEIFLQMLAYCLQQQTPYPLLKILIQNKTPIEKEEGKKKQSNCPQMGHIQGSLLLTGCRQSVSKPEDMFKFHELMWNDLL